MAARRRFTAGPGAVRATKVGLTLGAVALTLGGWGVLTATDTIQPATTPPAVESPRQPERAQAPGQAGGTLRRGRGQGSGIEAPTTPAQPPTTQPNAPSVEPPATTQPSRPAGRTRSSR
jgi:hypothetical protein